MHDLAYTNPTAQHLPDGWNFPTMQPMTMPVAGAPAPGAAPVTGGGAATVTRLRWGRLVLVLAGMVLLAFGAWSMSQGGPGAHDDSNGSKGISVSGGGAGSGADEVDIAKASRGGTDSDSAGTANLDSTGGSTLPDAEVTPPADAVPTAAVPTVTHRRAVPGRRRAARHVTRRVVAGGGAGLAATTRVSHAAPAVRRSTGRAVGAPGAGQARGGGAQGELPYTGLSTWIAAILGILLLGAGICVQVNAVRLAATAMLYRRGILLRPVDCARLAQERGLPQVRVAVSNVLHRLLEEPAAPSDFVAARHAR